jgi:hypothetical protein
MSAPAADPRVSRGDPLVLEPSGRCTASSR